MQLCEPFARTASHSYFALFFLRQVVLCDNPEEMADYIDKSQLTKEFGGELSFDTNEWTEHRSVSPSPCETLILMIGQDTNL